MRDKLGKFQKGFKHKKETIEKFLGRIPANKGIKGVVKLSNKTRKKMSKARKGHIGYMLGKKHSIETRKKMKLAQIKRVQEGKHNNYKGGITSLNHKIRESIEYRLWREAVFARDNFTCQKTGEKGGEIVAHHIHNFADYPELRTSIENGITLSIKSHKEFHKIYGNKKNNKEQLIEFISKT